MAIYSPAAANEQLIRIASRFEDDTEVGLVLGNPSASDVLTVQGARFART